MFNASLALRDLQKEFLKSCDDYGRCNCLKGHCDKGLNN